MDIEHRRRFGEKIRLLRENKGASLTATGKATGITRQYLWALENAAVNRIPPPGRLRKLSRFFSVTVEDLLADAGYLQDPEYADDDEEYTLEVRVAKAFMHVINDPRFPRGGSLNPKLTPHEAKFYIVELYQRITGQKLL